MLLRSLPSVPPLTNSLNPSGAWMTDCGVPSEVDRGLAGTEVSIVCTFDPSDIGPDPSAGDLLTVGSACAISRQPGGLCGTGSMSSSTAESSMSVLSDVMGDGLVASNGTDGPLEES